MKKTFSELTVLRGILNDRLIALYGQMRDGDDGAREDFLYELFLRGAENNFTAYVADVVLRDENPFSRAHAADSQPSDFVTKAFIADLEYIQNALQGESDLFHFGVAPPPFTDFSADDARRLADYYAEHGYGKFLNTAFRYQNGQLIPIVSPSPITLEQLKGYEREKAQVKDNLENFVSGLPFADMLLYGDRGTGKSSTVHAMVNYFSRQKLRLVELSKEDILDLPKLKTYLADIPMRFIVFIDDFSLSERDDRVSTLKAALQGSMEGFTDNVMIVATSNRRHIVEETFDSRQNSVHQGDSEEELLSLSDRFGVTVLFSTTNKPEYLNIVRALAADCNLHYDFQQLDLFAERWALFHGGRSPRRAKQFIDYAYACEKKGVALDEANF